MIEREIWKQKISTAWETRPIVWLSGVRRSGKTTLAKMFDNAVYFNCDLPSVQRQMENPEFVFQSVSPASLIIFDEIHRLSDPSLVLKIGADEFPDIRILATGSSTLAATKKFRDSLTGRKIQLFLSPVLWSECQKAFNVNELDERLILGGLPGFLLSGINSPELYAEWIESYYARDIQELFDVRNRTGFLKLLSLLFMQSGGILEITSLSKDSGLSRPTVMSHLESLAIAHAIITIPPFFGGGSNEVLKRPKVYTFDTGFVCHVNGWNELRDTERGILWEHLVLDMLRFSYRDIFYWMNREKQEIDFVVKGVRNEIHAYECKLNPDKFNIIPLKKFREIYPSGRNFCISPYIKEPYNLLIDNKVIEFRSVP